MQCAPIPVPAIATEAVASVGRHGRATANVVEMWYRPRRCAYEKHRHNVLWKGKNILWKMNVEMQKESRKHGKSC